MKRSLSQRALSLFLSLTILVGLLPATLLTAWAGEPFQAYIFDETVSGGSASDTVSVASDGSVRFAISFDFPSDSGISLEALRSSTITLYQNVMGGTSYVIYDGLPSDSSKPYIDSTGFMEHITIANVVQGDYDIIVDTHGVGMGTYAYHAIIFGEGGGAPTIQNPTLSAPISNFDSAIAGVPYYPAVGGVGGKSIDLTATAMNGGTLTWTMETANVPSGLTVELTGADNAATRSVHIYGTQANSGTVTVTVKVTEAKDGASRDSETVTLRLTVNRATTYQVTFARNGGAGAVGADYSTREVIRGYQDTITLPSAPTRDGFTFRGWMCSADGETYAAGAQVKIEKRTAFSALWEDKGGAKITFPTLKPVVGHVYLIATNGSSPYGTTFWSDSYDTATNITGKEITTPFWDIYYNSYNKLELKAYVDGQYQTIAQYEGPVGAAQAGQTVSLTKTMDYSILTGLTVKAAVTDPKTNAVSNPVLTENTDYQSAYYAVRDAATDNYVYFPQMTTGGKNYKVKLSGRRDSAYYTTQYWTKTYETTAVEDGKVMVTLDQVTASVTVSGVVTNTVTSKDQQGNTVTTTSPVEGATVKATQYVKGLDRTATAVTDADGKYTLTLYPSEESAWYPGTYHEAKFSVLVDGSGVRIGAGDSLIVPATTPPDPGYVSHSIALNESKVTVNLQVQAQEGQEALARRYLSALMDRSQIQLRQGNAAASNERSTARGNSLNFQETLTPYSSVAANAALTVKLTDPVGAFFGETSKDVTLVAGLGSVTLKPTLNPGVLVNLSAQTYSSLFLAWYDGDGNYVSRTDAFSLGWYGSGATMGVPAPRAGTYTLALLPASYSSLLHAGDSTGFVKFSALPEGAAVKSWTVTLGDGEIRELEAFQMDGAVSEAARYVTKPASTLAAGARSFSSTGDIITFTGTIGLDAGLKDGKLKTLIIDPTSFSGQNSNDNMTLSVESVAIDGKTYSPGRPVDHDDQYYMNIPEGVDLPCTYTIYAHPQTYRLNMEIEVNAHVSHDKTTDYWQRIGQASVARPGSVITTPSAYVCDATIPVSGMAQQGDAVTLYDNGKEVGRATAGYDGSWKAQVTLADTDPTLTTLHSLTAVTAQGVESLPLAVYHRADMPQLTSLTMSWGSGWTQTVNIPDDFYNFTGSMSNVTFKAAFQHPENLWQINPVEGSTATEANGGLPPFKVLFRVTTSDGNIRLLTANTATDGVFEVKIPETLYSSVIAVDCEFAPTPELMDNYNETTRTAQATAADKALLTDGMKILLEAAGKAMADLKISITAAAATKTTTTVTFDDKGNQTVTTLDAEGNVTTENSDAAQLAQASQVYMKAANVKMDSYTHETKSEQTLSDWLNQLASDNAPMAQDAQARFYSGNRVYTNETSFTAEKEWVAAAAMTGTGTATDSHDLHLEGLSTGITYDSYAISDFVYDGKDPVSGTYRVSVDFITYEGLYMSTVSVYLYPGFSGYKTATLARAKPFFPDRLISYAGEGLPPGLLSGTPANTVSYYYNGNYQCDTSIWDFWSGFDLTMAASFSFKSAFLGFSELLEKISKWFGAWADAFGGFGGLIDAITACMDFERDYKMDSDLIELMSTPCYMKLDAQQKARCEAMYQDFKMVMRQRQEGDVIAKIGNFLMFICTSGLIPSIANGIATDFSATIASIFGVEAEAAVVVGTSPWFAVGTAVAALTSGILAMATASELHAAIAKAYNSTFHYISFLCSQKAMEMEDPNCKKKKEKEDEEEKVDKVDIRDSDDPYLYRNEPRAWGTRSAGGRLGVQNDPSGVVYEAVIQNPVEGAVVTLYYGAKDGAASAKDETGTNQIKVAADIAHMTPVAATQITGADGRFQWFVPEGQWYVAAERAGYEGGNSNADAAATITLGTGISVGSQTVTNMLPVLPVQLDVNIPLVDETAPYVTDARFVAGEGIYVTFSKYMKEDTVTAKANYQINGTDFAGDISVVESQRGNTPENIDQDPDTEGIQTKTYTKAVKLEATELTGDVNLTVKNAVKSYAGTSMAADYTTTGAMETKTPLTVQPQFTDYGTAENRTNVTAKVDAGTKVALSLPAGAPDGAKIYYTTDGNTPTGATGKLYTGPIPVAENLTIKAVAALAGYEDSEVSTGTFTISTAVTLLYAIKGSVSTTNGASPEGLTLTLTGGGITRTAVVTGGKYTFPNLPRNTAYTISFAGNGAYPAATVPVNVGTADVTQNITLGSPSSSGGWDADDSDDSTVPVTPPAQPQETAPAFADVSEAAWYYDAVQWAAGKGITTGKPGGVFDPTGEASRAEVVTFLWRCAGEPEPETAAGGFPDVAAGAWYFKPVQWAAENGITMGFEDGTFRPEAIVTREQFVTFLYRMVGSVAADGENPFTDVKSGDWSYEAIQWAAKEGITNGTGDGLFSPDRYCDRGQTVTMLYRWFGKE